MCTGFLVGNFKTRSGSCPPPTQRIPKIAWVYNVFRTKLSKPARRMGFCLVSEPQNPESGFWNGHPESTCTNGIFGIRWKKSWGRAGGYDKKKLSARVLFGNRWEKPMNPCRFWNVLNWEKKTMMPCGFWNADRKTAYAQANISKCDIKINFRSAPRIGSSSNRLRFWPFSPAPRIYFFQIMPLLG